MKSFYCYFNPTPFYTSYSVCPPAGEVGYDFPGSLAFRPRCSSRLTYMYHAAFSCYVVFSSRVFFLFYFSQHLQACLIAIGGEQFARACYVSWFFYIHISTYVMFLYFCYFALINSMLIFTLVSHSFASAINWIQPECPSMIFSFFPLYISGDAIWWVKRSHFNIHLDFFLTAQVIYTHLIQFQLHN